MANADGAKRLNRVFEVCADDRRRVALRCLREHGALTLPDLAEEVACRESDADLPEIPADSVQQVYFSLYHTHVPKLQRASLAAYEQESDRVEIADGATDALCEAAGELESVLK